MIRRKQVMVTLPEEYVDYIRTRAEKEKLTVSQIMEFIVDAYIGDSKA